MSQDQPQNTTGYNHPRDPNLNRIENTLKYNDNGEPVVRTSVDGINLQGDVIVDKVKLWDGTNNLIFDLPNNDGETAPWSLPTENHNMVFNGSTWDRMRGNTTDGVLTKLTNGSIAVTGTFWQATQPVSIATMPTTPVTGTVSINQPVAVTDNNGSITVDGTVTVQDGGGSLTVDGTVTVQDGGGSLTVDDGGGSLTVDGTVEVSNDSGNPLPISKNTSTNTLENPIYVEQSNVATTSKDRMKITSYTTGFFNTFQHGKALDVWDESFTSGGNATHDDNRNAVLLSVTSTPGSKVIRQTRQVMRYVPGRPAEYSQAFIMGAHVSGIRIRIGQFDEGDGFYLERAADGTLYAVIRSSVTGSPVESRIAQSSWNGDKLLNGTGPSGLTLDLSKTQLLVVDYEWYGTGAVQFSFVINNQTIKAHTFYHANVLSDPWCSTPFIPMRVELENVSATASASMFQISSCHSMESLSDNLGFPLSIATPITGRSLQTQNTYYPIISIRLKSTALNSVVVPQYIQAGTLDNTFINYQLLLNATLTGASWVNHPTTESVVQYDVSATSYTGGTVLNQGFAAAGYNDRLPLNENSAAGNFQIGRSSLGTVSDIFTVVVAAGTSNKAGIAVMNWIEQR